jgi:comEA protein
MSIVIRKARLSDIAQMQNLVREEVENGIILPRSDDEIATNIRSYCVLESTCSEGENLTDESNLRDEICIYQMQDEKNSLNIDKKPDGNSKNIDEKLLLNFNKILNASNDEIAKMRGEFFQEDENLTLILDTLLDEISKTQNKLLKRQNELNLAKNIGENRAQTASNFDKKDDKNCEKFSQNSDQNLSKNLSTNQPASQIVGYAALHIHSKDLAEVRSLIVSSHLRGRKMGRKIVEALIAEARFYGLKSIFTLTYRKAFFERLGFIEIPKSQLPQQKIWADCIKCKHFPVCNEIALILDL